MTEEAKQKEVCHKNILRNNKYNINGITTRPTTHEENTKTDPQRQKTKGATFTYIGKEAKTIIKFFKETSIKTAFRTWNTIQNIINPYSQMDK
jgi:hypothetical protein